MSEAESTLTEHYRALIQRAGLRDSYPKSHWSGCNWARQTSALLPSDAPAELISCNTCLMRRGYIRIVLCDPRLEGWPWTDCDLCESGVDHDTWLRVKGVGKGVERILRRLDPDAEHPVTWADVDLVPFKEDPAPEFENKPALDKYCAELLDTLRSACASKEGIDPGWVYEQLERLSNEASDLG